MSDPISKTIRSLENITNVADSITWDGGFSGYLQAFFARLEEILGDQFGEYHFQLVHHNTRFGPVTLPFSGKNAILIWLGDESGYVPLDLAGKYRFILKSYLPFGNPVKNIHPFPICGVSEILKTTPHPFQSRKFNVFFSGNLNTNRIDFYRQFSLWRYFPPCNIPPYTLRRIIMEFFYRWPNLIRRDASFAFPSSHISFTEGFGKGMDHVEYAKSLADSKIAICPAGFNSPECMRHFEAMCMGCVIVSCPLPPNRFYYKSPIIQLNSWNQLHGVIKRLLGDPARLQAISEETTKWWNDQCSPDAMARHVAQLLK